MHNAWREIQKLNENQEIWWDSSPVEEFDEITSFQENMEAFQKAFREMIDYVGSFL